MWKNIMECKVVIGDGSDSIMSEVMDAIVMWEIDMSTIPIKVDFDTFEKKEIRGDTVLNEGVVVLDMG